MEFLRNLICLSCFISTMYLVLLILCACVLSGRADRSRTEAYLRRQTEQACADVAREVDG